MITVKVFPTLRPFLPPTCPGGTEFSVDLSDLPGERACIEDLISFLRIPRKKVNIAILNGQILRDFKRELKEGDRLVLSPPIAGG